MSTAAAEIEVERARARDSNAVRGMMLSDRDRQRRELQARADEIAGELKDLYLRSRLLEREQSEIHQAMREL